MLRRLHPNQPTSFAFSPENQKWAEAQLTKYPEGRQASAIIPLLWRAQEQEGWLSRPAIEFVADMLGMAHIRALEVATFYFMFQLQPVGSAAHIQVCGTLSCMLCGAEDLVSICKEKISPPVPGPQNGRFSVEPSAGLTSLSDVNDGGPTDNKSVSLAKKFNDTVKRIDGTDDTITIHWGKQ